MLRNPLRYAIYLCYLSLAVTLSGCEELNNIQGADTTSSDYPYLLSSPQVSAIPNINEQALYDVTVTLQATGPNPLQVVTVLITSVDEPSLAPVALNLQQYLAGSDSDTWSATTSQPLPAGNYRISSVALYDGDGMQGGIVKSGIYSYEMNVSTSNYTIIQLEQDYSSDPANPTVIGHTLPGTSDIAVIEFDPSQL